MDVVFILYIWEHRISISQSVIYPLYFKKCHIPFKEKENNRKGNQYKLNEAMAVTIGLNIEAMANH